MKRLVVWFEAPFRVRVIEEDLPSPAPNQVVVKTLVSAVSPGTEMLLYRGQWPADLAVDASIPDLAGKFAYPLKYGYSAVGQVVDVGADSLLEWLGKQVFSFHPHESHFVASPDQLICVPDSLSPEEAAFLPNMETAVSFLMDGRPMLGELVAVFGQGVVGLLTTGLLARMSLGRLLACERFPLRREHAVAMGADVVVDPVAEDVSERLRHAADELNAGDGADLVYELSGNPAALDLAISLCGFGGRIVVGSWYGTKRASLDLGGHFHRNRIGLISSQVSSLAPELTGRWTKQRRLRTVLRMLQEVRPARLITHRYSVHRADAAYALVHESPHDTVQVMITYEDAI